MLRYPIPFAIAGLQTGGISSRRPGIRISPEKVAIESLPEHTCSDAHRLFHQVVLVRLR